MKSVRAIATRYAGCNFRSRLEARWAVFFDALGIPWEYEPQGYESNGSRYLPDFLLTRTNTYVEVKPNRDALQDDWQRILDVLDWGSPMPGIDESHGTARGLLILGVIPRCDTWSRTAPVHPILQHHKGVYAMVGQFTAGGFRTVGRDWTDCGPGDLCDNYYDSSWGGCRAPEINGIVMHGTGTDSAVMHAYNAARSARFEHGQSGAT